MEIDTTRIGFAPDEIDTAASTRAARLKWVVVVNEALPPGRAVNAAVCVSAATVSGVRGVTASGELAAVRRALAAAGVEAELPSSTDTVPAEHRELVGWVIREGVTNVIRHSGASRCRIRISEHDVTIDDDGRGPGAPIGAGSMSSTGLRGLRERVESAGGSLRFGPGELGGFTLTASLPDAAALSQTAGAQS